MIRSLLSITALLLFACLFLQNANCKKNGIHRQLMIDGIDAEKLNAEDIFGLLTAEDEKFIGQLDIWTGKQILKKRHRIKRYARFLWIAARQLFKSLKTARRFSKNGGKITKQYFKKGGFKEAYEDFKSFKPTNIKEFRGKNGQHGYTGKILDGKYQITVRKNSSSGEPTLEFRSNTGGNIIRKVRYQE